MTDTPPDERPARQQLEEALRPLCPRGWVWITDERPRDDDERTRVHLLQRTIDPGRMGSTAAHRIGFECTVTVPGTDMGKAEAQLDDDIVAVLYALTSAGIQWTTATKATYDGRLGYQFHVELGSKDKRKRE